MNQIDLPAAPAGEPSTSADDLVARAAGLRERIREEAAEGEARGGISPQLHEAFREAGFYRLFQPRRYGGHELGLEAFVRLVAELGRADASTAWSVCLAADHVFHVASFFSEEAQDELFGPGHFCAPHRAAPTGTAEAVAGGYRVTGQWDYCSGVTHATHFIATAMGVDPHGPADAAPVPLACVIPAGQFTILDDWGGGATLGLQGTGSNSVRVDDVLVPTYRVEPYEWKNYALPAEGTPGYRLHGNPLYLGRSVSMYYAGLAAPIVGAAYGALDEYEAVLRTRTTPLPPRTLRAESPDYQRWFGEAQSLADTAQLALFGAAARYDEHGRRWAAGEPFTVADDVRLRGPLMHAGRLAWEAIDRLFATGGSMAAKRGSALQRIYRDGSMYRTHIGAQYEQHYTANARVHLGIPTVV
jgi:3-hydroxy-9,10-secoandrosta-1,3,5(10)-triene-9,17-dione monooxygenase